MLADIDAACEATGVWPHAIFSGHAHTYHASHRVKDGRQTPYIISGNGGHAHTRLTKKGQPAIRTPLAQPMLAETGETITFENYDDGDYGYMRVVVDNTQFGSIPSRRRRPGRQDAR